MRVETNENETIEMVMITCAVACIVLFLALLHHLAGSTPTHDAGFSNICAESQPVKSHIQLDNSVTLVECANGKKYRIEALPNGK